MATSSSFEGQFASLPQRDAFARGGGTFWRKEPPILDANLKVITGGMLPHQREWWDADQKIKILVGGYGSGKTLILSKWIIATALLNAPVASAIITPNYPMARTTTVPTMHALLEGKRRLLGRKFHWTFSGQAPMTYRIYYGSREATIFVLSSERPEGLKGPNFGTVVLEEPFMQERAAFDQMLARLRAPAAIVRQIGLAGTPEQLNWGYSLCEGDLYERHKPAVIRATSMDNTTLPPDYVETLLAGYDEMMVQAYLHANFIQMSRGQVYHQFNPMEHVCKLDPPSGSRLVVGMDFNVNPMAFCVGWIKGNVLHIVKEYELPNADTEYACQVLREDWGHVIEDVYPDATGKARATNAPNARSDFTILREHGFHLQTDLANPTRKDRYNSVNRMFKAASGEIRLTFDPSCKKLIEYSQQYTHENMKKQEHMSHLLDALGYIVSYQWPVFKQTLAVSELNGV